MDAVSFWSLFAGRFGPSFWTQPQGGFGPSSWLVSVLAHGVELSCVV